MTDGENDPIRVLIVDDEPCLREALGDIISDYGHEVVGFATDGHDACAQATSLRPQVVIMDLRMPCLDGIEATRQVRSALPATQVIVFSAYDDPSMREAADDAGAFAFLVKGSPIDQLVHAMEAAAQAGRILSHTL